MVRRGVAPVPPTGSGALYALANARTATMPTPTPTAPATRFIMRATRAVFEGVVFAMVC